jgi:prepilin-type N-terminal cleavage/methylation domain-containing protein
MTKSANSRAGVTLIEILIAVSLLSLLTLGILFAMHLGFSTMDRTDARLVSNRRVVNARKILESEIDGFIFTMATFGPAPESQRTVIFFQAEPQSMRFVSSYSLQDAWRGRAQVAALQVVPGENNEGVRLIVNETPWTGPAQTGQTIVGIEPDATGRAVTQYTPILPGPQSFVLADKLRYCRFSYLEKLPVAPFEVWQSAWTATSHLPFGIRVEMAPLDTGSADLHVTTATVPLNVNLAPGVRYADQN